MKNFIKNTNKLVTYLFFLYFISINNNSLAKEINSKFEIIYKDHCVVCHGGGIVPKITIGKDLEVTKKNIQIIIEKGGQGKTPMPSFESILSKEEISFLAEYIANSVEKRLVISPDRKVDTLYYPLKIHNILTPFNSRYGGIDKFNDSFLLMDIESSMYIFKNKKFIKILGPKIPIFREDFIKENPSQKGSFGIKDIKVTKSKYKNYIVYASSTFFDKKEKCFGLGLFRSEIKFSINNYPHNAKWERVFQTQPCIKIIPNEDPNTISVGGKIAILKGEKILLTVGDFNHFEKNDEYSQNLNNSYGKVISIDLKNYKNSIYSLGHRNPQGIVVTRNSLIYLTEHGPRGGDELNNIKFEGNYGWPYVSFGTRYDFVDNHFPKTNDDGTHYGYVKPIFSWTPSIGISGIIETTSLTRQLWQGNLLIASLRHKSLFRLYLHNNIPIMIETIFIGSRIRNLTELVDGRIVLLIENDVKDSDNFQSLLLISTNIN
jgi:glucose/arabinose dehydrogenase